LFNDRSDNIAMMGFEKNQYAGSNFRFTALGEEAIAIVRHVIFALSSERNGSLHFANTLSPRSESIGHSTISRYFFRNFGADLRPISARKWSRWLSQCFF
jgi:hypothetical protein